MPGKYYDFDADILYDPFDLDYEESRSFVFSLMVWLVRNKADGKVVISQEDIMKIWGGEKSHIKYDIVEGNITLEVIDTPNV